MGLTNTIFLDTKTLDLLIELDISQPKFKKIIKCLIFTANNFSENKIEYAKKVLTKIGGKYLKEQIFFEDYCQLGYLLEDRLETHLKETGEHLKKEWIDTYEIMVNLMLEGAKNEYSFWSKFSLDINSRINKLRIESIAAKTWRDNHSECLVFNKLIEDPYFQEATQKFGQEKTEQLISEIIKNIQLVSFAA